MPNPRSVAHTPQISSKIGSQIHSVSSWKSWLSPSHPLFFFFFFSQIVESIVIPGPLFTYRNVKKAAHDRWINKDVLCSLQWESDLKYLYYHIARHSKEVRARPSVQVEMKFPKENAEKWQQRNEKRRHVKTLCHVCSSSPLKPCFKCHPPPLGVKPNQTQENSWLWQIFRVALCFRCGTSPFSTSQRAI